MTVIVKPTDGACGRGITIYPSIHSQADLASALSQYDDKYPYTATKSRSVVVQRYISNPLLFDKRKFDIRVYLLYGLLALLGS